MKINVRIKYFLVHEITGKKSEDIELEAGTTLGELLQELVKRHGKELGKLMFSPDGKPGNHLRIFFNGRMVDEEMLEQEIEEDSEVNIFMAIIGG